VGALGEAHRVGLIHRDVKPANILLCERGGVPDTVKVVDFGLVKQLEAGDATVTQADTITGTPAYLAPEMIASPDSIDARADLYCLGGVAYFMLTGAPAFAGGTLVEVCGHHLHTQPEPPSARSSNPIPAALEALVLRCLAKKPEDRPANAALLEEQLVSLALAHPWKASDARVWWGRWRKSHPSVVPSQQPEAATTVAT
jgi:serine/threonine-protein kinase